MVPNQSFRGHLLSTQESEHCIVCAGGCSEYTQPDLWVWILFRQFFYTCLDRLHLDIAADEFNTLAGRIVAQGLVAFAQLHSLGRKGLDT